MSELNPAVVARVAGRPITEVPADLFIPPDALEVLLDSFSGPLDLLLYLIRRQNIDILDIPILLITQQYMQYIQLMEANRLELAADYLVMAAVLAEIKSRLLLPPSQSQANEIEEDPRSELIRRLQAYEQIKNAAEAIDNLPRAERDFFRFVVPCEHLTKEIIYPDVTLANLTDAMSDLIKRQSHTIHHQISREPLSVRERMNLILESLSRGLSLGFNELFNPLEGRRGLVVSFLAILELVRLSLVTISQFAAYSSINIQIVQDG